MSELQAAGRVANNRGQFLQEDGANSRQQRASSTSDEEASVRAEGQGALNRKVLILDP